MSKEQNILELLNKTRIVNHNVEKEMKKSFMSYAMAVNVSRAIPDVRDGLKPVHRRILFGMDAMGINSDKPYKKCARIVGDVMGKYHPHGDSSIYDALVRLAQDFSINTPLIDGKGNFGSIDGDSPAAMRYTESRLSKISDELMKDIDKETVNFVPNYDGTEMQPVVLPARFPNLLVNGSDGIAVGMATNIPPHNLGEVIDATIALITNPEITIDELLEIMPAPDYPTRAIIMGRNAIKEAYRTGRGGVVIRARAEIKESKNGERAQIVITELPYQVNKSRLIVQIADLVKDKRTEDISDIRDESDRNGIKIVIDVKKDANPEVVLNLLYKHTQLQTPNGIILLALKDGMPKVMNLKEILNAYIQHQEEVVSRRSKYLLNRAEEKLHILNGLIIALNNIDAVIKLIKQSQDKQDATQKLCEQFSLTEKQAVAILDIRLQRLTGMEIVKLNEEIEALNAEVLNLKHILESRQNILEVVTKELGEIREKYAVPRKTELRVDYGDINIADLIKQEDVVISMTHEGYIKRLPVAEYRAQKRGGRGVNSHKTKEEDFVENMFISSTHDDIMFFTNMGKVYRIKGYEIPEASRQSKGRAAINLIEVDKNEKIQAVLPVSENNKQGSIVLATRNGLIKKTNMSEFESIRKNGKYAITLLEGDELINVEIADGNSEILIATNLGKCIKFKESDIRESGRTSQGVRSIHLRNGDKVVDMTILKPGSELITISENGYGKRSIADDYRLQSRGGMGIKAGAFNEKTGKLVSLKQISKENDIMLIASNGVIIRIHADSIGLISRHTQGVRLMKLAEDDKVMSVALAEREDDADVEELDLANAEILPDETDEIEQKSE